MISKVHYRSATLADGLTLPLGKGPGRQMVALAAGVGLAVVLGMAWMAQPATVPAAAPAPAPVSVQVPSTPRVTVVSSGWTGRLSQRPLQFDPVAAPAAVSLGQTSRAVALDPAEAMASQRRRATLPAPARRVEFAPDPLAGAATVPESTLTAPAAAQSAARVQWVLPSTSLGRIVAAAPAPAPVSVQVPSTPRVTVVSSGWTGRLSQRPLQFDPVAAPAAVSLGQTSRAVALDPAEAMASQRRRATLPAPARRVEFAPDPLAGAATVPESTLTAPAAAQPAARVQWVLPSTSLGRIMAAAPAAVQVEAAPMAAPQTTVTGYRNPLAQDVAGMDRGLASIQPAAGAMTSQAAVASSVALRQTAFRPVVVMAQPVAVPVPVAAKSVPVLAPVVAPAPLLAALPQPVRVTAAPVLAPAAPAMPAAPIQAVAPQLASPAPSVTDQTGPVFGNEGAHQSESSAAHDSNNDSEHDSDHSSEHDDG